MPHSQTASDRFSVLVTGGAGYIGSHTAKCIAETTPWEVTVLDDFSTGDPRAVRFGGLVTADVGDAQAVRSLLAERRFDAILHFAASIVVPESVGNPGKYYENNTANSIRLFRTAAECGVPFAIFSSTAAVYGLPDRVQVDEDAPLRPISPYGWSKAMSERVLWDIAGAAGMGVVALRYFNAAGAASDGGLGRYACGATHLVQVASEAALGLRSRVEVFGTDYPTPDGTGVRDYIHVDDLASAHRDALVYLRGGGESRILNCGYGKGASVREVLAAMRRAALRVGAPCPDFPETEAPRRAGDPHALVADVSRIRSALGWRPRCDDLDLICESALKWERHISHATHVPHTGDEKRGVLLEKRSKYDR